MIRKITFLTLFLWLMTVTFPVIAQQKAEGHVLRALEWQ